MNGRTLDWDKLTPGEKAAVKLVCEADFYTFMCLFYEIVQGTESRQNWHVKYLCGEMERMIRGECMGKSLILNMPPGAGKTEIFSIHATVWAHIVCPKVRNYNISYSDELIKENSERIKEIIKHQAFQELWPCDFRKDKDNHWKVYHGESVAMQVTSRSMGGGITGGRAGYETESYSGCLMLDDPDKPDDMFSTAKRTRVHRLLKGTIKSRRASMGGDLPPTPFVIDQQRLHVEDTTGFLLSGGIGGNIQFVHVVVPALIDQAYIDALPDWIRQDCIDDVCGTEQINGYWSFYPRIYSAQALIDDWTHNEYNFLAQYMQRPIRLGGNLFHSDWWRYYGKVQMVLNEHGKMEPAGIGPDIPAPPSFEYRFITADTASKTKEVNDWSVFCEWGVWDGKLYLLKMFRKKVEATELRASFKTFVEDAWNDNSVHKGYLRSVNVEDKSSGTTLIQELRHELPLPITAVQRHTDKLTRAMNVIPKISEGLVVLPFGAAWIADFVTEHSEFSADDSHKHDDIVDNVIDAVEIALMTKKSSALELMRMANGKR